MEPHHPHGLSPVPPLDTRAAHMATEVKGPTDRTDGMRLHAPAATQMPTLPALCPQSLGHALRQASLGGPLLSQAHTIKSWSVCKPLDHPKGRDLSSLEGDTGAWDGGTGNYLPWAEGSIWEIEGCGGLHPQGHCILLAHILSWSTPDI